MTSGFGGFVVFFFLSTTPSFSFDSESVNQIHPWHDFKRGKTTKYFQLSELNHSDCILFIKASKHAKKNCFIVSVSRANIISNPNIG